MLVNCQGHINVENGLGAFAPVIEDWKPVTNDPRLRACSSKYRSASSAAMQPVPADVIA